jgi:hypothetical protein
MRVDPWELIPLSYKFLEAADSWGWAQRPAGATGPEIVPTRKPVRVEGRRKPGSQFRLGWDPENPDQRFYVVPCGYPIRSTIYEPPAGGVVDEHLSCIEHLIRQGAIRYRLPAPEGVSEEARGLWERSIGQRVLVGDWDVRSAGTAAAMRPSSKFVGGMGLLGHAAIYPDYWESVRFMKRVGRGRWKNNPDVRRRELERRAATGDWDAKLALNVDMVRSGQVPPPDVEAILPWTEDSVRVFAQDMHRYPILKPQWHAVVGHPREIRRRWYFPNGFGIDLHYNSNDPVPGSAPLPVHVPLEEHRANTWLFRWPVGDHFERPEDDIFTGLYMPLFSHQGFEPEHAGAAVTIFPSGGAPDYESANHNVSPRPLMFGAEGHEELRELMLIALSASPSMTNREIWTGTIWDWWSEEDDETATERFRAQENPDELIRRLERLAAAGDAQARYDLLRERHRRGMLPRVPFEVDMIVAAYGTSPDTWPGNEHVGASDEWEYVCGVQTALARLREEGYNEPYLASTEYFDVSLFDVGQDLGKDLDLFADQWSRISHAAATSEAIQPMPVLSQEVVSFLPIDVGFDVKLHEIEVSVPPGALVRYEDQEGNVRETTDVDVLREAGYMIAPGPAPLENPESHDARLRRLERLAAAGDTDAAEALDRERARAGMQNLAAQRVQARKEIEFSNEILGQPVMFPDAVCWGDLFEKTMSARREEIEVPVPPDLQPLSYREIAAWVRDNWGRLGLPWYPEAISLSEGHDVAYAYETKEFWPRKPEGWGELWFIENERGETCTAKIGPLCFVDDTHEHLYVQARPEVYEAVKQRMLGMCNEQIDFDVMCRSQETKPHTILVSAKYNTILGSRRLAILPALELPTPRPRRSE